MTTAIRKYSAFLKCAGLVPYKITHLSTMELAEALREGYKKVRGADPTAEVLASGWAQAILESGRPVKLPNNNIGNIKATKNWIESNDYFVKDAVEFTRGGEKFIEKAAKWRAYPTPTDGAAGYWQLINDRYGKSFSWMAAGDPIKATKYLKKGGWFTCPEEGYAKASNLLYSEFMKTIAPNMSNLQSNPIRPPSDDNVFPVDEPVKPEGSDIDALINRLYAGKKRY